LQPCSMFKKKSKDKKAAPPAPAAAPSSKPAAVSSEADTLDVLDELQDRMSYANSGSFRYDDDDDNLPPRLSVAERQARKQELVAEVNKRGHEVKQLDSKVAFRDSTYDTLGISPKFTRGRTEQAYADPKSETEMINALIQTKERRRTKSRELSKELPSRTVCPPYSAEWEPRVEALMLKFPDIYKAEVVNALLEFEGHAGHAERKLVKAAAPAAAQGQVDASRKSPPPIGSSPSASSDKKAVTAKERGAAKAAAAQAGGRFVTDEEWSKVQAQLKELRALKHANLKLAAEVRQMQQQQQDVSGVWTGSRSEDSLRESSKPSRLSAVSFKRSKSTANLRQASVRSDAAEDVPSQLRPSLSRQLTTGSFFKKKSESSSSPDSSASKGSSGGGFPPPQVV